jgi:hypothetical protein
VNIGMGKDFKRTLSEAQKLGWSEDLIRESLWNTAYLLGRKRWYWGPMWMSSLHGWINSRLARMRKASE